MAVVLDQVCWFVHLDWPLAGYIQTKLCAFMLYIVRWLSINLWPNCYKADKSAKFFKPNLEGVPRPRINLVVFYVGLFLSFACKYTLN